MSIFGILFSLGARAQKSFYIYAPSDARKVILRVYADGVGGEPISTVKMKKINDPTYASDGDPGICEWTGRVKIPVVDRFYTFEVTTKDGISHGETPGIDAKAVGINGKRAFFPNNSKMSPKGWNNDRQLPLVSPADLVIYEMHHRDFSIDESSGLKYKGKFLALTEQKALDYLKDLGINAVHILPSFDFASIDESSDAPQYNWGYDPLNYNVPEGSYSTDAADPYSRIVEFKKMVMALHQAGIRVILDVVYNHTFDINGSNFQRMIPDYYYRKNADGTYSNGSGCGNETASEKTLMRKFILESVLYWAKEYHIDGFRFDLMGVHDIETMNLVRLNLHNLNPSIFIYGEGWSAGSCAYPTEKLAMKANIRQMAEGMPAGSLAYGSGIAAFSDDMRDALRGPFNDDTKGAFLAGLPGMEESLKFGIAGAIYHPQIDMSKVNYSEKPWAEQPVQQISYVSCHDDMCLVDRLKASIPGITTEELIRLDLLAQTAVFTSQGVPFILSGEEMLRDKKGVHNSYNSPDEINHLDWNNLKRYPQVFAYYKNLIAMRKNHRAFRLAEAELVRQHLEFFPASDCLVAFRLKELEGLDEWNDIIVILNGNKEEREVEIPDGKYTIVCCDGIIDEKGIDIVEGNRVVVDAQSALIIHQ